MNAREEYELNSTLDVNELDELESYDLDEILPPEILPEIRLHEFEPIGFDWA